MRILIILFLFMGLIGCATAPTSITTPETPQPVTWGDRVGVLSHIENWDVSAMIAIRNNAKRGADSANMQWQQNKQNYSILLFGPLGSNSVHLTGRPGNVLLEAADGKKLSAKSPEMLLTEQTGYHIPVSNLYYWIRGLPVPAIPAQKRFDNANHLLELNQEGWLVQFLGYTSVNQIDMPDKIFLSNPAMTVKIVIHKWKI